MTNKSKFTLLVVAVPATMLLLIGYSRYQQNFNETRIAVARLHAKANALARDWGKFNYVPIAHENFSNHLRTAVVTPAATERLSHEQKEHLVKSLLLFFRAYSEGTYEAYTAYRFPPGIAFHWKTNKMGSLDTAIDTLGFPRKLKNAPMNLKFEAYVAKYAGTSFMYSNHFTDVAFEQSRLVVLKPTNEIVGAWRTRFFEDSVAQFATNFPHFSTNWAASQRSYPRHENICLTAGFPNLGYVSQKEDYSFIQFEDDAEDLQRRDGSVTLVDCFFLLKRTSPWRHPILPIIVRLYWHPDMRIWLPDDCIICNSLQKGDPLPIF